MNCSHSDDYYFLRQMLHHLSPEVVVLTPTPPGEGGNYSLTMFCAHVAQEQVKRNADFLYCTDNSTWQTIKDHWTDCMDFFELSVGLKGVPQDRHQRIYILSIREDRLKKAIRNFYCTPTSSMVADGLTKSMISDILYDLLTHGYWRVEAKGQEPLVAEIVTTPDTYNEKDLVQIDKIGQRPKWAVNPSVAYTKQGRSRLPTVVTTTTKASQRRIYTATSNGQCQKRLSQMD